MLSDIQPCEYCGKKINAYIYRLCDKCREEQMKIWEKEKEMEEREYRNSRL